jgi:hypothetical protein
MISAKPALMLTRCEPQRDTGGLSQLSPRSLWAATGGGRIHFSAAL